MLETLKNKQTIIASVLWLAFAIAFLGVYEQDIIYNLHLGSFFCNAEYYHDKVIIEDGHLTYLARYLSQFFIYPLPSAIALSVALCGISIWLSRIIEYKPGNVMMAFLPAFLCALLIGIVGKYMHNAIRDVLTLPCMGLFLIVGNMWVAKKMQDRKDIMFLYIDVALVTLIGFIIGGVVGFFAGLGMACTAATRNLKQGAVCLAIAIACTLYMTWWYSDTRYWLTPLTNFDYKAVAVTELFVFLSPSILILDKKMKSSDKLPNARNVNDKIYGFKFFNIALAVIAACATYFSSERHSAFRGECKLTRLMVNNDFKGMVKAAKEIEEPNWACYGLRLIGLDQTGKLEEDMFKYTCRKSDFPITYEFHYPWLNLYAGQPLYSLSYAMDYHLFKEENYLNMMAMAYDYILVGEKEAAEKILSKMDDNIVYRKWCEKIRKHYGSHIEFAQTHKQFGKAMMGAFRENIVIGQIPFEATFKLSNKMNGVNISRRVYLTLFEKDMEGFKILMNAVGDKYNGALPEPIQEAICILAINGDNDLLEKLPVSPIIGTRANNILGDMRKGMDYDQIAMKYGDSYFTYFFFAVKPERNNNQ